MQADQVEQKISDLSQKLVSLDWHDNVDAIDAYFSKKAEVYAKPLYIRGVRRIIKQVELYNHVFTSSEVIDGPRYNEGEKVVYFSAKRRTKTLSLPLVKYIPIARRLNDWRKTVHFDLKLQLSPKKQANDQQANETPMLVVTRMDINMREKIPLANYIPHMLLKPFLSTTSNVVATVSKIATSNSSSASGIFKTVGQTFDSFWKWGYGKYANVKQSGFKKQDWADQDSADLPSFSSYAVTTAHDLGQGLETRAKRIGLPIDKIKKQAQQAVHQLTGAAAQAQKEVQNEAARLTEAGEDKGEKVDRPTQDSAPDKTDGEATSVDHPIMPALGEPVAKDSATDNEQPTETQRPLTPLGGTDPTTEGAPSYAQMAAGEQEGY